MGSIETNLNNVMVIDVNTKSLTKSLSNKVLTKVSNNKVMKMELLPLVKSLILSMIPETVQHHGLVVHHQEEAS